MKRRKRPFWLLVLSLLSLASLIYVIIFFPPSASLILNHFLPLEALAKWGSLPITIPFFLLLFSFLLFLFSYLTRNIRRGGIIALLIVVYLIFRMLHLNSPYFLLLLIALFISLELFFKKKV